MNKFLLPICSLLFLSTTVNGVEDKPKIVKMISDEKIFGGSQLYFQTLSLIKKSYHEAGFEINLVNVPNERGFQMLLKGEVDADIGRMSIVIDKLNLNFVNVPLVELRYCLYSVHKTKGKELEDASIIMVRGTQIPKVTKLKNITYADSLAQAIEILKKRSSIDYLFFIKEIYETSELSKNNQLNCVHLYEKLNAYHVLSEKKKYLIPILEPIFKKYFPLKI